MLSNFPYFTVQHNVMRPIITATDFSDVATAAVHYACELAKQHSLPVSVVHSYTIPVTFHENPMPAISLEEGRNIAQSQMDKLISILTALYQGVNITGSVVYGDITDNLKDIAEEQNAWMVVVGNSSTDDSGFWLGSNLLSTLRHVPCPVLAVPMGYSYRAVERIGFACDFNNIAEQLPTVELTDIVAKTDAQLHVINVDHENKNFDPDSTYEQTVLDESIKQLRPEYHYLDSEDVDEALQQFVTANNIDWLIVIPHKHSFFESLFHKSQTKAIVKHAHVPLLALHDKG